MLVMQMITFALLVGHAVSWWRKQKLVHAFETGSTERMVTLVEMCSLGLRVALLSGLLWLNQYHVPFFVAMMAVVSIDFFVCGAMWWLEVRRQPEEVKRLAQRDDKGNFYEGTQDLARAMSPRLTDDERFEAGQGAIASFQSARIAAARRYTRDYFLFGGLSLVITLVLAAALFVR